MSAYVIVLGSCVACGTPIRFNPSFVPSIRVNGEREPLCRACFNAWNGIHRASEGLPLVPLHPAAYEPEPTP